MMSQSQQPENALNSFWLNNLDLHKPFGTASAKETATNSGWPPDLKTYGDCD